MLYARDGRFGFKVSRVLLFGRTGSGSLAFSGLDGYKLETSQGCCGGAATQTIANRFHRGSNPLGTSKLAEQFQKHQPPDSRHRDHGEAVYHKRLIASLPF